MNFLEVRALTLKLGATSILEGLDFSVPEHSFLCIIGPNGAGKSMFIKILLGLIGPTQGHVRLWGKAPQQHPREWVGYVPQIKTFDRSFPGLSYELVLSGLNSAWPAFVTTKMQDKALKALERVGAKDLAQKSLHQLSGGELQRVFLARAFIQTRRLLILDEPATGIDSLGEADLYPLLEDFAKETGCNILMITHDVDVARHHASHVLLLNHRQIQFSTREEGLSPEQLQRAFGHSQHEHIH